MFLEGKIKKYNAERGFGFIEVGHDQADIFFHISDFPKIAGEPKLGERLKFLLVEDKGKFKAANIVRLDLNTSNITYASAANQSSKKFISQEHSLSNSKKSKIFTVMGLIVIAILMVLVFQKYQSYQQSKELKTAQLIDAQKRIVEEQRKAVGELPELKLSEKTQRALESHHPESIQTVQPTNTQFKCDGRTHCSQMHSYEEALFFLRNCPNTKMDGNNDGEPCERQFGR